MNQGDWEDILEWANNPETPNRNGDTFPGASGGNIVITGGTGVGTHGSGGAVTLTGGTGTHPGTGGAVTITAGRVIFPEFEIVSSPTFRVSDIATRRFDLIARSTPASFLADTILDAVVRAKTQHVWVRVPSAAAPSRTVWELLVDSA
jgi:hypothetical protein